MIERQERRSTPRRRLRDRVASHQSGENPVLGGRHELANVLLLLDDDLRETVLAMGGIEAFLAEAIAVLDGDELSPEALAHLGGTPEIIGKLDTLSDTLGSLRRHMRQIAHTLRR